MSSRPVVDAARARTIATTVAVSATTRSGVVVVTTVTTMAATGARNLGVVAATLVATGAATGARPCRWLPPCWRW
jgi:hypothetical protein